MRALMNTKMAEETPVRDHVFKMFDHSYILTYITCLKGFGHSGPS